MRNEFEIENGVLRKYSGPGGDVSIPAGVREIGSEAFSGCVSLERVAFPAGLAVIGDFAFMGCRGLAEVTLPEGVTFIDRSAFSRCTGLKHVSLPSTLTGLGEFAFAGCWGLREIELPAGLERIDRSAFSQCRGLEAVALPEALGRLERGVFYGCARLREAFLPKSLRAVAGGAFSGCDALRRIAVDPENPALKAVDGVLYSRDGTRMLVCPGGLREISVPEGVTEIGPAAFYEDCHLDRIPLPATLRRVGEAAFCRCAELAEIALPEGLEALETSAFSGCRNLTRLVLPDSVREIGESAFRGCGGLQWMKLPKDLPFDPHWFAAPHDPACFSVDKTVIPFVSTRPIGDIDSELGTRRAALGFIRADMDGIAIDSGIAAGYVDYLRERAGALREEMLADDEVLRWMLERRMVPPGEVEGLVEQAAALGRAGASVLLLDYQNRAALQMPTPGGQLEQRFEALENALDF